MTHHENKKHYLEAALALFELESEITGETIEAMMFTYANEVKAFDSLFEHLEGYDPKDNDLIIKLHDHLIDHLNNQAFTSVKIGLTQLDNWIEIMNELHEGYLDL